MSDWKTSEWGQELRDLWNQYDPIGVFCWDISENTSNWPLDEYDSYHGVILKHLNDGSDESKIFHAIKNIVTINIGMTWNDTLENKTRLFVKNVLNWFEAKKPELAK